jgi:hypothetical protein
MCFGSLTKDGFVLLGALISSFYTDNEWNDCPNINQGYAHWNTVFGKFDQNWYHTFDVSRPTERPENFSFIHKKVLYIGLNLVGGRVHNTDEWLARLSGQLQWVQELVESYINERPDNDEIVSISRGRLPVAKRVVLFGHADPTADHADFFEPLADYIVGVSARIRNGDTDAANGASDIAFLYLNGDSHVWKYEPNFFGVPQFSRIQVEGGTRNPPVEITVDIRGNIPGDAEGGGANAFSYDRMLELIQ